MTFPKGTRFGMTLEGMKDREHGGAIQVHGELSLVPFGVGVVDVDERGDVRWWRIRVGIVSVRG